MKCTNLIISAFLLVPLPVLAETDNMQYYLGASVNYMETKYEFAGFEYRPEFTTLNTELVVSRGPAYIRVNYDQSIKDDEQFEPDGTIVFFSRKEYGLALGYEVYQGITIHGGYLSGEINFPALASNTSVVPDNYEYTWSETGLYLGANYSLRLGKGAINVHAAYASLDGKYEIANAGGSTVSKTSGSTRGQSYGINWSQPINKNFQATIGYRVKHYRFEADDIDTFTGDDLSTDFDTKVFTLGIMALFD